MRPLLLMALVLLVGASGCKKGHVKDFKGTYDCELTEHFICNGCNPVESSTTVTQETIKVKRKAFKPGQLEILGELLEIDENGEYFGDHHLATYSFTVKFNMDSIYILYYSGGLGSGTTYIYKGAKQ